MFEYFKDNYQWSLSTMMALEMGAPIGEVHDIGKSLLSVAGTIDEYATEQWYQAWRGMGERAVRLAGADQEKSHELSASTKLLRASIYLLIAERHLPHTDPRKAMVYDEQLARFRQGSGSLGFDVEFVEIPYRDGQMPGLFVPAKDGSPAPCLIMINGLDSTKEMLLLFSRDEFAKRGVSILVVDQPGTGGALRKFDLTATHETEKPVAKAIDYLESRTDVLSDSVGVLGISLGGYYAPRAAAFESRLRCCVAWGGIWDLPRLLKETWERGVRSVEDFQLHWVFGTEDKSELDETLSQYTLEGKLDGLTCPLLVVHGVNDRQAPLWCATETYQAAGNSSARELKLFEVDEGGAEHCQLDNVRLGIEYMADWVARTLRVN